MPASVVSFDVTVDGRIIESSGTTLKLAVTATDATGRAWIANKEYEGRADTRAYKDGYSAGRDPFENVYVAIADDLLAARKTRSSADLANIRRVSELRFAADFAPVAFSQYLAKDAKSGQYKVLRLPADDDLLLQRIRQIRERDYGMIDTVSENYAAFSEKLQEPYTGWRRYTYDEITAEEKLKAQARNRMAMGAAAVAAAIFVPDNCKSGSTCDRATSAARYGAVAGGVAAVISGYRKNEESKIHAESLKEISGSFQSEAAPLVVDVEGRTLRLTGTAEEQYAEWRRLLHELYREETGLVPTAPAADATHAGSAGGRRGLTQDDGTDARARTRRPVCTDSPAGQWRNLRGVAGGRRHARRARRAQDLRTRPITACIARLDIELARVRSLGGEHAVPIHGVLQADESCAGRDGIPAGRRSRPVPRPVLRELEAGRGRCHRGARGRSCGKLGPSRSEVQQCAAGRRRTRTSCRFRPRGTCRRSCGARRFTLQRKPAAAARRAGNPGRRSLCARRDALRADRRPSPVLP